VVGDPTGHPGPRSIELPAAIVQQIVDQARAEDPNESCGIVIGTANAAEGGTALRYEPARNRAASPYLYDLHPDDLLRLTIATEDADEAFWAIVHSHTHTPARPSPTDIRQAVYPDSLYLLISLAADEADPTSGSPSLRAWRIVDGTVFEVEVRVTR
jgi:proteasome lid subunit RPN8/RPN11